MNDTITITSKESSEQRIRYEIEHCYYPVPEFSTFIQATVFVGIAVMLRFRKKT